MSYRMITIAITAVFIFLTIIYITFWKGMDLTDIYREKPIFFGHRGDSKNFPENTIASYSSAIKNGLNAIELDVMLTKDNRLVCSHNFDLERETNGAGFIDEIDYKDLVKVKTGRQFPINKQTTLPLLMDVVTSLPKTVLINIEIKTKSIFDLKAAIKVAKKIKSGEISQRVIVSSFNPLVSRIVKLISQSIPTGFIYEYAQHFMGVFIARPDCLFPETELITDKLIKFCRKRDMRINAWTVNNVNSRDWLISKNIDGIITDNPRLAGKN
ncbi:glycerophosphodiester phosphodiesterase [Candidatus Neomarinimicrobiota bacterium]